MALSKIKVLNANKKLTVGSWYPKDEEELICKKLNVVVFILWELNKARDTIMRLKNHPIHEFTKFLWDVAAGGMIQVGQLEFLVREVQAVADDFKRSKNAWVKERTSTALRVMNEIICGDYIIDASIYTDPEGDLIL